MKKLAEIEKLGASEAAAKAQEIMKKKLNIYRKQALALKKTPGNPAARMLLSKLLDACETLNTSLPADARAVFLEILGESQVRITEEQALLKASAESPEMQRLRTYENAVLNALAAGKKPDAGVLRMTIRMHFLLSIPIPPAIRETADEILGSGAMKKIARDADEERRKQNIAFIQRNMGHLQ
jgi:hypothetical protein